MLFQAATRFVHKTFENSSMAITKMIGAVSQIALANHPCKGLYSVTPQMYIIHYLRSLSQFCQLEVISQMIRALKPSKKDKALLVHDKFCNDNQGLPSKGIHTITTHQTIQINIDTVLTSKTFNHLQDTRKYRILTENIVSHPKYIIIRCYKHLNTNTPPFHTNFLAHISSSAVMPI